RSTLSRFLFQAEDGIRDFHVTGVQTCALPISSRGGRSCASSDGRTDEHPHTVGATRSSRVPPTPRPTDVHVPFTGRTGAGRRDTDRKSTRLNSSHVKISYAVFCLKKKIKTNLI